MEYSSVSTRFITRISASGLYNDMITFSLVSVITKVLNYSIKPEILITNVMNSFVCLSSKFRTKSSFLTEK